MDASNWVLEIQIPGLDEPKQLSVDHEIIIGRGPEVALDLTDFGAIEKGVSRQHVVIVNQENQLVVTDLNAANGTLLNDKRLVPGDAYHLGNDDNLILGTLKLKIKVIAAPSYENVPRKQTDIDRKSSTPPGNGETVLIVEDHVEVAQLFSMMLQRQGFVTQISRDANRALRFLSSQHPDAVVLDLMLPGVDGLEICRYIRRDKSLDNTPIIIVSANRNEGIEQQVIEAGADVFLSKPVNASELGDVVAEFIEKRQNPNATDHKDKDTKMLDDTESAQYIGLSGVGDDTVAVIVANQMANPFSISLRRPVTFGRYVPNSSPRTHVDLSRFRAEDYGVSRVHMIMSYKDGEVFIEDVGSLNGTFLSGRKVDSHEPTRVYSGQEIKLGRLPMRVYFMSESES